MGNVNGFEPTTIDEVHLPSINAPANILTSSLGGDVSSTGSLWSLSRGVVACTRSSSSQTSPPPAPGLSSLPPFSSALSVSDRRRLHRSINSPGYSYGDVISVDARGELWRRYTPKAAAVKDRDGRRDVPHRHRAVRPEGRRERGEIRQREKRVFLR